MSGGGGIMSVPRQKHVVALKTQVASHWQGLKYLWDKLTEDNKYLHRLQTSLEQNLEKYIYTSRIKIHVTPYKEHNILLGIIGYS